MQDRQNDLTQLKCEKCNWKGRALECKHEYYHAGYSNIVAVDRCPNCKKEEPGRDK